MTFKFNFIRILFESILKHNQTKKEKRG